MGPFHLLKWSTKNRILDSWYYDIQVFILKKWHYFSLLFLLIKLFHPSYMSCVSVFFQVSNSPLNSLNNFPIFLLYFMILLPIHENVYFELSNENIFLSGFRRANQCNHLIFFFFFNPPVYKKKKNLINLKFNQKINKI